MGQQMTYVGTLTIEVCCSCGMSFAMPADYQKRRRDDHKSFYCPAGHKQYYSGESEEERLKRQLAAANGNLRHSREIAETERRRAAAYKGIANKQKKALLSGHCPVCEAHLDSAKRLTAHIKDKHPDYTGVVKLDD